MRLFYFPGIGPFIPLDKVFLQFPVVFKNFIIFESWSDCEQKVAQRKLPSLNGNASSFEFLDEEIALLDFGRFFLSFDLIGRGPYRVSIKSVTSNFSK